MRGDVILMDRRRSQWLQFSEPVETIVVTSIDDVLPALRHIEEQVEGQGLRAAGFITYEAAPTFDPAFAVNASTELPLLWFGLYPQAIPVELPPPVGEFGVNRWQSNISQTEYKCAIRRIKAHIGRGETYQVNFTFRLQAAFAGKPWTFFAQLVQAQQKGYPAFVDTGRHVICSASPELFFWRDGLRVTMRPMKGTAPRGLTFESDAERAACLAHSAKDRAENVMIVDMIRNDLSTIADLGTVNVPRLFEVECYPTVLQMTSTITAQVDAPTTRLISTLFPCASITGAPKIRTTEIIAQLETSRRGVYTGCIGFLSPGRQAQFNVAIRTVSLDTETGLAEYGVGSGIVWDSDEAGEYSECQTKAQLLRTTRPPFDLLETILWEPPDGYFLLDRHLQRLANSAAYFEIPVDLARLRHQLEKTARSFAGDARRVRVLVSALGAVTIEPAPFGDSALGRPFRVRLAARPVNSTDPFLYHKTTYRQMYEQARAAHPDVDDVLLWNERGEITESCIANVVVQFSSEFVTPPVRCGLLAGTFRQHLLERQSIKEAVITCNDLSEADNVYLINSVRKWVKATMVAN